MVFSSELQHAICNMASEQNEYGESNVVPGEFCSCIIFAHILPVCHNPHLARHGCIHARCHGNKRSGSALKRPTAICSA